MPHTSTLSDPDEHVKEVYAHFGLAMYLAQCIEHAIVLLLVYTDLIPRWTKRISSLKQWQDEFDLFMYLHFEQTLGRLLNNLRTKMPVPSNLEQLLVKSLKKRNWLAHDYFRERAVDFMSKVGRDGMIQELQGAQELFTQTEKALDAVVRPIRERQGLTDDRLQSIVEHWKSQFEADI